MLIVPLFYQPIAKTKSTLFCRLIYFVFFQEFFPGWKLRIYTPTPNDHARIPLLPTDIIQDLRKSGVSKICN